MGSEGDAVAQAKLFATYLIGQQPSEQVMVRYEEALQHSSFAIKSEDVALLSLVIERPWTLRFVDAGLALVRPHAELRRRLYLMLAILESSPEYTAFFLPQKRSWPYVFSIIYSGARAACMALVGVLIVKAVR